MLSVISNVIVLSTIIKVNVITLTVVMLSAIMVNVIMLSFHMLNIVFLFLFCAENCYTMFCPEYHCAEFPYANCYYAEKPSVECRHA
jgi:hypothetical protein